MEKNVDKMKQYLQRVVGLENAERAQEAQMQERTQFLQNRTPEQLKADRARGWMSDPRAYNPDAEVILPPEHIPEAPHSVQKSYLDYLKDRKERTETGSAMQTWINFNRPEYPYGRAIGVNAKTGKEELLPIQGPANWSELWTDFESIGDDLRTPIDKNMALLQTKVDELKESLEKLTNIKFVKEIAEGSFGTVWKVYAVKITLKKVGVTKPVKIKEPVELACKAVRWNQAKYDQYIASNQFQQFLDDSLKKTVLNDMLTLKNIEQHDNICGPLDVLSIPDTKTGFPFSGFLIFMDLCDGDLFSLLEKSCVWVGNAATGSFKYLLTEKQSKYWFRQIAKGLQYLHSCNCVHLDIKPENILYKYRGQPNVWHDKDTTLMNSTYKLCDFGMSMAFPPDDQCFYSGIQRQIGSVNYMAPEMVFRTELNLQNTPIATKPCDVHSLGATLAFSLFGYYCLPPLMTLQLATANLTTNMLPTEPIVSEHAKKLVAGMLCKNPKSRLTIDAVLAHKWLSSWCAIF